MGLAYTDWGREIAKSDRLDRRTQAVALAIALLGLNVLDVIVTRFNIHVLGASEANVLVQPVLGTPWEYVLKFGIPLWIILLASAVRSTLALRLLRLAVAVYLVVAIINIGQIAYTIA